jgi:hypothetical protein
MKKTEKSESVLDVIRKFIGQFIEKDLNLLSTITFLNFEKLIFSDFRGPQKLQFKAKNALILDF